MGPQGRKIGCFFVCHWEPVANHILKGLVEHQVPLHWVLRVVEGLEEEPFLHAQEREEGVLHMYIRTVSGGRSVNMHCTHTPVHTCMHTHCLLIPCP